MLGIVSLQDIQINVRYEEVPLLAHCDTLFAWLGLFTRKFIFLILVYGFMFVCLLNKICLLGIVSFENQSLYVDNKLKSLHPLNWKITRVKLKSFLELPGCDIISLRGNINAGIIIINMIKVKCHRQALYFS